MTEIKYRDFDMLKLSQVQALIPFRIADCNIWNHLRKNYQLQIYGMTNKTVRYGDLVKAGLVQK